MYALVISICIARKNFAFHYFLAEIHMDDGVNHILFRQLVIAISHIVCLEQQIRAGTVLIFTN